MAAFEQTLVLIRERSFLDQLDLALVVIRRRPVTLAATLAVGAAPFVLLNGRILDAVAASDPGFPLSLVLLWLIVIEAPLATAPLTVVLGGLMFGDRPRTGRVAATLLRALPHLILFQVIVRTIFLFVFFLTPLLPARLPFLNEVILLEATRPPARPRSPAAVVSRCLDLTRDRSGDLFVRAVACLIFAGLFILAFTVGASILVGMLVESPTWRLPDEVPLTGWDSQLAVWIAVGFLAVVRFLGYLDQRIRLEGWEIELRFKALGAAMEADER